MNSIEFNYKKNTILGSIDKYIAYLCDEHDTVVSGYKPEIYTDINRLERDYPYTPYLDTFKNLMNKGIAVMMIPILSGSSNNNYHSSLEDVNNKYRLVTKQYNIPVTLVVSKWLDYYKWTIISRNYSEEFYVTYNGISNDYDSQPEPTDEIISPSDIGDYSEVIRAESIQDGLSEGTYEFLVTDNSELSPTQSSTLRTAAVNDLIGSDWYPDFIVVPGLIAGTSSIIKNLVDKLLLLASDQFSQLIILKNKYSSSFLGSVHNTENRSMILSTDNYYYEGTNNSFILPFVDMFLNYGKYQMVITDNVLADIYEPDDATSEGKVNSVSYNDLNNYYIDRVYDLPGQQSYFIIRYYISRFSRLLARNSSNLKSNNTYIRDKFISDTIDKMLIYDNINSIKLVNSDISGQKLSMEFEIEVNYLMNKRINFNVTFNIA